ncbi:helix-turn-helix transcriptional regulator [Streptomyces cinnamoneus]|uniref:helix-turn-helix transcriptional regulator n=1 Tax=Streptomyces cinnamoneus TaxID=53446 RepID=UPI0033C83590
MSMDIRDDRASEPSSAPSTGLAAGPATPLPADPPAPPVPCVPPAPPVPLGEDETAVYGWVLDHQSADPSRAAADLGIAPEAGRAALDRLIALRLVVPEPVAGADPGRPAPARAVDPDAVVTVLTAPLQESIHESQLRLQRVRDDFERLRERFLRGRAEASPCSLEVIPSLEEVRAALNRASAECRTEMMTSQPGGTRDPEAMTEALARDTALLERGIRIRTLYHHTARFNGPSQAYVAAASALGAEYRTAHELFGRIIIFDRELAFIPDHLGSWGAVAIRDPSVVAYLCEIFEQTWTHATLFSEAGQDGLERVAKEVDLTIIRLLAAGLKDESIGRRLGMSLRTTRRHIADIMETLGAESRFQAGILASRAGLIDDGTTGSTTAAAGDAERAGPAGGGDAAASQP